MTDYQTQQKIRSNENEIQALKVRIKNLEGVVFRMQEFMRQKIGGPAY